MGVGDVNMKCAGDVAKGYALAWVRLRVLGISGAVPLSLQKNSKGGEKVTQLACGSNKSAAQTSVTFPPANSPAH